MVKSYAYTVVHLLPLYWEYICTIVNASLRYRRFLSEYPAMLCNLLSCSLQVVSENDKQSKSYRRMQMYPQLRLFMPWLICACNFRRYGSEVIWCED